MKVMEDWEEFEIKVVMVLTWFVIYNVGFMNNFEECKLSLLD